MAAVDRLHGAHGQVKMDPLGTTTPVVVASLNSWDLDMATDKVPVTAFGDPNKVYVQGLPDIKGSYGGFYDPVDGLVIFSVVFGTAKPALELYPDAAQTTKKFAGRALMDSKISVSSDGAVTVGGSFVAAGPWTFPTAP